jgi:PAS domain S-box-containing protein
MNEDFTPTISSNSDASLETDARLELLYEIGRILASLETVNQAAPQILEVICRRLDFALGELWYMDEQYKTLRLENVWHRPLSSLEIFVGESRQFEFAEGVGLPGKVWAKGAPVWIETLDDKMPRKSSAENAGLQSGFAFPILLGEKLLGVFSFFSTKTRRADDSLLQVSSAIGNHIGQFIKREKIESNLRESEDRYRAFIAQSTEGIWRFELEKKIPVHLPTEKQLALALEHSYLAECNDAMAQMYGLEKAEELVGKRISDLLDMNDASNVEYLRAFIESGYNLIDAESHEKDVAGNDKFFLNSLVGSIEDGNLIRVWGTQRDITNQKRAEKSLLESEANLRQLAETVPHFVWITEANGSLSYVNEQWLEFSGLTLEQTNDSLVLAEIFHPDDIQRLSNGWKKAFIGGEVFAIELRMRNRRGEYRWFLTRTRPVKDADGKILRWFGTSTDITEGKQAENRLALLAEISELTRTLEDPNELLAQVSRAVGEHLDVRRCLFNEIDLENDLETVHLDYCKGVESVAGVHLISEYSSITSSEMIAGKTVVNDDSKIDSRTAADYEKIYKLNGERAYIAVPLLRENRWVASLWVSTDEPRHWSRQEISMLETIAERTWTAIEKLRIDAALRASEQHLQLAVDISRISTFEIDLTTDALETDAVGRAIYGFEADEPLTFAKVQARFHPDDKDEVLRRVSAAFVPEGAGEFEVEQRIVRTNGEVRWIRVLGRVFFETATGDGGERRAVRCLGTYVDITNSKRAEEKLRESDAILQTINRNSPTLIYLKDRDGRILNANPATLVVLGKAFPEVIGKTHEEYSGKKSESLAIAENDRRIIETGKTETFEETVLVAGVPHAFLSTKTPYRNQAGEIIGLVGVSFDITERKQAERERERLLESEQQAREAAERANHAKDEFIALVSHELRSPLNAMLGWTRILQNQKTDEKTNEYALDVIVRNARAQSKLIEDLLDIARVSESKLRLEMKPTELIEIITAAIEIIKPAADSKNIKLTQTLDRAASFITGDDDRLRQVVENILSNAIKFTPEGGAVDVRLERENQTAKFIVSDTGQGISAEFLPQIFERFRQADPSVTRRYGGLGIGLSLARDLVELHGGSITAESAGEGKGSIFTVKLPLRMVAPIKENNSDTGESMNAEGKLSGFWILAVDDEADAREIVSFMLQMNGARVTSANSAVEALEILKGADGKLPDVLLSDISMPNESGYALLEKVRALPEENGGQIPAVALTAFNRPEDRQSAFEAGFQKHLGKPVEMEDLIAAIIETANGKH